MSVATLIAAKGQPVTLTYHAAGTHDPTTHVLAATPTTVVTSGVVLPISRGLRFMAGTAITADDQQLLLPGDIAQPAIGTTVTIGSKDFTIVEVSPLAPSGTAQIYDCIIRGVP